MSQPSSAKSSHVDPWAGAPVDPDIVAEAAPVESSSSSSSSNNADKRRLLTYWDYIGTDHLLNMQGGGSNHQLHHHDEHLFIVVHQTFELWFKQILWELNSIRDSLARSISASSAAAAEGSSYLPPSPSVVSGPGGAADLWSSPCPSSSSSSSMPRFFSHLSAEDARTAAHRLQRADTILRTSLSSFDILETMHPGDFLEFRDHIGPASGFQSLQLRQLELVLGLKDGDRVACPYATVFTHEQRELLNKMKAELSLKESVDSWLCDFKFPAKFVDAFLLAKRENLHFQKSIWIKNPEQVHRAVELEISQILPFLEGAVETVSQEDGSDKKQDDLKSFMASSGAPAAPSNGHVVSVEEAAANGDASEEEKKKKNEKLMNSINQCPFSNKTKTVGALGAGVGAGHDLDAMSVSSAQHGAAMNEHDKQKAMEAKARTAAMFITSYRAHPSLAPYADLIDACVAFEEAFLLWRTRHARMVERMIGRRMGTGGSMGVAYLDSTLQYRVFVDLFQMRSMFVRSSSLPPLEQLYNSSAQS